MRNIIAAVSISLAISIGGGGTVQAAEQMEGGVWVDSFRAGNSRTGRLAVFFYANDNEGKVEICGNYFMWGGSSVHRFLRRALNRYRFYYNGRAIFSNASFLWEALSENQLGDEVLCRLTDIPYTKNSNDLLQGRMPYAR